MEFESDIEVGAQFEAALEAGLQAMGAPDTSVVLAQDFAAEIRSLTLTPEYSADRVGGAVGGKTIRTTTGELVIVLNATVVLELDLDRIERLAAHEAGHVLIDQHREDVDWEDTAGLQTIGWRRIMTYLAANALDEYRVESAVMALGYPVNTDAAIGAVESALMDANAGGLEAALQYRESQDVLAMRDAALTLMDRFSKQLANLIASQPFAPLDVMELDDAARANWHALVSPIWQKHLQYYSTVPDARTRCDRPAIEGAIKQGWLVAVALMRSIGFEYRGGDDESFWSVRDDAALQRAYERYEADAAIRGEG